jgi:predicted phage terminase large subunit-like protein
MTKMELLKEIERLPAGAMTTALDAYCELYGAVSAAPDTPVGLHGFVESVLGKGFRWYRHTEVIAEAVEGIVTGDIQRLMVVCPPQHGKTEVAARLLPAAFLRAHPQLWVGLASYGADIANSRSRDARDYYLAAGGKLRPGAGSQNEWQTQRGGGMWSAGVGGAQTGRSSSLLIIDDPVKNYQDACSPTMQEHQRQWYRSAWLTRENPNADRPAAQVHIQTRWHENDLAGYIIDQARETGEVWHVVHLAHVHTPVADDLYPDNWVQLPDWREVGDVLCPELRTPDEVELIKRKRGAYFWSALDQGNPMPAEGGGLFKDWWFDQLDEITEPITDMVRAWDIAAGGHDGDSLAGVKLGRTDSDQIVVLDVVERKVGPAEVKPIIRSIAQSDGPGVMVRIPQDPAAAGKIVAEDFRHALQAVGCVVDVLLRTGSKRTNALPLASAAMPHNGDEHGRVAVLGEEWAPRLLSQLHRFTGADGGQDDLVDAMADGFNYLDSRARRAPGINFL